MPFYVALDSADVWAHPSLFALSEDGTMLGVAGVPPDYFNSAGQLWGMPVFNWDAMEQQGYRWWIKRTERNMELFDLVRFDHFRAFSSYWEVPGGEETAINGRWLPGPGEKFFDMAYAALGRLPFVAEDLGDIDEAVYELRDRFNFPGMRVLQFAFGNDMDSSVHIPHNYTENSFVYTGTHDNNTSLGWYLSDIGTCERSNLEQYTGRLLTAARVPDELIKLAYSSRANGAIIPVQDVLCLNASARMNNPARPDGNWLWRLLPDQLHADHARKLAGCAEQCGR